MKLFFDETQLAHRPKQYMVHGRIVDPFENPNRATTLIASLERAGLQRTEPKDYGREPILMVHADHYVAFLEEAYARFMELPDHGPEVLPNVHPYRGASASFAGRGEPRVSGIIGRAGWYMGDLSCAILEHSCAFRFLGKIYRTGVRGSVRRREPARANREKRMSIAARSLSIETSSAADMRRRILAIVGASSGNLVEWYDFYAYSFTALYFAAAFFPTGNRTTELLNAAGVFAAGFFMRPLGGWLFGWIADTHGRRTAMIISVLMMCAGSLLIAVLPTYASIGAAAPVLMLFARLVQGLSVGGEYGTSATYMSEVAARGHRGFYASFQYVTLIGGQLLALVVLISLQAFLSADELKAWGWRVPFLVGAIAAVVALFLRRSLAETASEESMHNKEAGTLHGMLHHRRAVLLVLGFTAGGSLIFYTFTTYMQKYLVNTAGMDAKTASTMMTLVLLVYMLLQPVFGAISDVIGRKNSMLCFTSLAVLATVPLLNALGHATNPYAAFGFVLLGLSIISFYTSISGLVKAELFPTEVRALGVGLSYAISNALFGGTAEYVGLWFKSVGQEWLFPWYVTALCAVALIASLSMPDTRRHGYLEGPQAPET